MRFEEVETRDAAGAVLAHGRRLGPAHMLKKGRVLSADDCAALSDAGVTRVVVARLEEGDIDEDEAARRVATAIAGPHVELSVATTGRANGTAAARGVLVVSRERLDAVNLVDEAITAATLPPYSVVETGAMVFTVKIIPFAVPAALVERACERAAGGSPLVSIAPLVPKRAGLLLTTLPGIREEQLAQAARAQAQRMASLGGRLVREVRAPHDTAGVARGLADLLADDIDIVLALGASAIVDRSDVLPQAIRSVGGVVEHLGMPVDPGNLLLLGRRGKVPIVGVPGCARSLRPSGFDRVLERLAADLPVTREDIMKMGAGGLLSDVPGRPAPRAAPGSLSRAASGSLSRAAAGEGPAPHVAAVVLAAGLSRRMGGPNKLLLPIDGVPMVARVVDAFLASKADPVLVVLGHQAGEVRAALAGRDVRFVESPQYEEGLGASLRAGIEAVDEAADGALVALGDMPWIRPDHIDALIAAFDPAGPETIVVPVHDRKRGHPVLWSARHFAEMRALGGDVGARALLEKHAAAVRAVPIDDAAVHRDVDTPEMLAGGARETAERGGDRPAVLASRRAAGGMAEAPRGRRGR